MAHPNPGVGLIGIPHLTMLHHCNFFGQVENPVVWAFSHMQLHSWKNHDLHTLTQLSKAASRAGTRICGSHLLPACLCASPSHSEIRLLKMVLPWRCGTCLGAKGSNACLKLVWRLRGENQSRSLHCIYCTMCVVTLVMSSDSIILLKFIPDKQYRYGYRGKITYC